MKKPLQMHGFVFLLVAYSGDMSAPTIVPGRGSTPMPLIPSLCREAVSGTSGYLPLRTADLSRRKSRRPDRGGAGLLGRISRN
jgi:hypothetical protein